MAVTRVGASKRADKAEARAKELERQVSETVANLLDEEDKHAVTREALKQSEARAKELEREKDHATMVADAAAEKVKELEKALRFAKREARVLRNIVQEDHPDELEAVSNMREHYGRINSKRRKLEAALEANFRFDLGGYNGPDYPENATESTWYIRSTSGVHVDGNVPPSSIAAAVLKLKSSEADEDIGNPGGRQIVRVCLDDIPCSSRGSNYECDADDTNRLVCADRRIEMDNAVCICGCSPEDHKSHGEDGEQCDHEDHVCIRVCLAARTLFLEQRDRVKSLDAALEEAGARAVADGNTARAQSKCIDDLSAENARLCHWEKAARAIASLAAKGLGVSEPSPAMHYGDFLVIAGETLSATADGGK